MDHVLLMGVLQRFGDLAGDRQGLFERHGASRDALPERGSLHQFHYQGPLFHAVDLCDIGVIQRGQDLGFASESGQAIGIVREGIGQDLDGDPAVELGICGAIDRSHAALAEFGGDAVVGNGLRWDHMRDFLESYHVKANWGRLGDESRHPDVGLSDAKLTYYARR